MVCGGNCVSNVGERFEGEVWHWGRVSYIPGAAIGRRYHGDDYDMLEVGRR